MELTKPKRPKYYFLVHILFFIGLIVLSTTFNSAIEKFWPQYDFISSSGLIIPLILLLTPTIYGEYKQRKQDYEDQEHDRKQREKEKIEQERLKNSKVNENIKKYLEEQKQKKLNSSWWQFWV